MSRGTVKVINETSEKKRRKKKVLPRTLQHILLIPLQPILQSFNIRQIVTLVGRKRCLIRVWYGQKADETTTMTTNVITVHPDKNLGADVLIFEELMVRRGEFSVPFFPSSLSLI
jgi:hypothetical protein